MRHVELLPIQSLQSTSSQPKGVQAVALLCFFPCFYASNFLFKIVYTLNQRRILFKEGEIAQLRGGEFRLNLTDGGQSFRRYSQAKEKLDRLTGLRERRERPGS